MDEQKDAHHNHYIPPAKWGRGNIYTETINLSSQNSLTVYLQVIYCNWLKVTFYCDVINIALFWVARMSTALNKKYCFSCLKCHSLFKNLLQYMDNNSALTWQKLWYTSLTEPSKKHGTATDFPQFEASSIYRNYIKSKHCYCLCIPSTHWKNKAFSQRLTLSVLLKLIN